MLNPSMNKNIDVTGYCVTKHAWKGNYKRLITLGSLGITTYHCETLKITNQWPYSEICSIEPDSKNPRSNKFVLWLREAGSKRKKDMRFSSDFRVNILTEAMEFSHLFQEKPRVRLKVNANKFRWNEKSVGVILEVNSHSISQIDPNTNLVVSVYYYKDIEMLAKISDHGQGFVVACNGFSRLHIFYTSNRDEFIRTVAEEAINKIAICLHESKDALSMEYILEHRMGKYSQDEHITSHAEFMVHKLAPHRHGSDNPVQRILCLTETCLVERDPETYILITLRPLCDIFGLIRDPNQPQRFVIEYVHGLNRTYLSTDRDSLLASLLDGARSSGNRDVCVKMKSTDRSLRFGPIIVPMEEEVESQHMKMLQQTPGGMSFSEAVLRFNANVSYSGLLHAVTQEGLFAENKEKLIKGALNALINREGNQEEISCQDLEAQFHALRRLVASKAGFQAFTQLNKMRETLGRKVVLALRRNNEAVTHAAIDTINALIQPMHENYDIRQEQLNKASIMSSSKFLQNLLDMFSLHVLRGTGALVISVMLDFLTFTICPPYCETSDGEYFDNLLKLVSDRGRVLFKLFHHPSLAIVKGAGLIMQALIDEADPNVGESMQALALAEGALSQHLLNSCFARNNDQRSLAFRQLNRQLISLWVTGNTLAKDLLKRLLPPGLILYLNSTDEPPISNVDHLFIRDNMELAQSHMQDIQRKNNEAWRIVEKKIDNFLLHWRSKIGINMKPLKDRDEKPVCLRKRRRRIKVVDNWKMFFYQFYQDHAKPNLIWNIKTREEFRDALEKEISDFKRERDFCANIEINEKTEDPDAVNENSIIVNEVNLEIDKKKILDDLMQQAAKVSWNFGEFKIIYRCLENEIKVGDYYLRLLLEEDERVSKLVRENKTLESSSSMENGLRTSERTSVTEQNNDTQNGTESDTKSENSMNSKLSTFESDVGAVGGVIKIRQSYEFFHDLYRRFLQYHKPEMKCMCLYAMSIVYGRCNKEIGPVNDCELFVSLLERTTNQLERDRLLVLIEKLIINKSNIELIIDAGGIRVLVDLITIAHMHINRAHMPQQSNVIEAAGDAQSKQDDHYKEWFYQEQNKEQIGPLSFKDLNKLFDEGTIKSDTKVWAQGLDQWRSFSNVPQIRWSNAKLHSGQAVFTHSDVASKALSILIGICRAYPSKDQLGGIIRPMPRCKKQLTQPTLLIHIVQLLLTFDPFLVEKIAMLLNMVFEENPYRSRLYITGVFYFILMYIGSNVLSIAEFLKITHMFQSFRSDEANLESGIVSRSILGNILPEAMICFIENHSSEQFAQIYLGDYDTPETIWNSEMRRFMIEKIACHLMEFTPRLPTNNRANYQYLAIPVISYPQLENELFCGSYYLRHLCDTIKFPDWPIRSPVTLLRDILYAWKNEIEKKPPSMSIKEAYGVLNLKFNENLVNDQATRTQEENLIRKAYFQLSMKYHPDRNPDGREQFEKINAAYQFLCHRAKLFSGPNPKNIYLLLKSQSILFQRCRKEIEIHKYSGYPMLIKTILSETEDEQLFQKETPLLAACAELAYHTVNVSALNAEELRRQDGIQALQAAFSRCVTIITASSTSSDFPVRVCGYITIFFSVSAQFEACRQRIQEIPQIGRDLIRLLYFKNLPQLSTLVCRCIADLSCDLWLQTSMFENGAIYHLLPYVFLYDYTLEEGGVARSEENHKQEILNKLSISAMLAITRLAGSVHEESHANQLISPENNHVRQCLIALLTPYIQRKITEFKGDLSSIKVILKLLTSNSENPYLYWDNRTRSELKKYVEAQQESLIKTSECDNHFGAEFKFTLYQKELIIGEVFIRLYNEQKGFCLENPRSFTIDLLLFLKSEVEFMDSSVGTNQLTKPTLLTSSKGSVTVNNEILKRSQKIQAALEALVNVIVTNPEINIQLIGHFKMLFSLMTYRLFPSIQEAAVEVVRSVTTSEECLEDIGASNVLVHLVRLLESLSSNPLLILDTISRVTSITSLLKELVYRGCLIYTLGVLCTSNKPDVRVVAAGVLGKMMIDKLVGNRIRAILLQFLPLIFLDAMKDNPDTFVHLYDNRHENPELIWNDDTRQCLSTVVCEKKATYFEEQEKDMNKKWSVADDFRVPYEAIINTGLSVGGVYLHLYVASPGWALRNPDEFCNQLFSKWFEVIQKSFNSTSVPHEHLELTTDALANLLNSQSGLLDTFPRKGYVHKVFQTLNDNALNEPILKAGLLIAYQMSNSKLCVGTMATIEAIRPLMAAMKVRQDQLGLAGETLFRLFQSGSDELVAQAIKVKLVEYVLSLLESGLVAVKEPGQVRAYLVKALKAMQRSPTYGAQITTMLENSSVWSQFKDQSHDLFLTNTPQFAGYLTGRSVETAGFLTSFAQDTPTKPL